MAQSAHQGSHAGSAKSWLAVIVILIGFITGAAGLILGPNWLVFWIGAGICAVGGLLALAVDIFSDVIIDAPRQMPVQEHRSPLERHH
jgi:hypothetical protein